MQALRYIKKTDNDTLTIKVPKDFFNREVEIIILPTSGDDEQKNDFDPSQFRGVLPKMTDDEINEESRKMRDEWERDI